MYFAGKYRSMWIGDYYGVAMDLGMEMGNPTPKWSGSMGWWMKSNHREWMPDVPVTSLT